MADKFNFGQLKDRANTMMRQMPIDLANQAQNYFHKSFLTQSWDDQQWKEVKRRIPGTQEYKYPKKKDLGRRKRPILVGKGSTKLRRAVAKCTNNPGSLAKWPIVRLIVDLPYARRHNEGLKGMPKRQFWGQTKTLSAMQKRMIQKYNRNVFKNK